MFVTARRAVAGLAVAVAVVGLAGCSGGGSKPTSLPSLTANTSASPAPTATGKAAELAAVSTVVHRYFSLLNQPTSTGSGKALSAIMTSSCSCRRVATSTIELARKRHYYFGANSVISVTPALDGPTVAEALVEYDYTAGGIRDAAGHVVSRAPGRKGVKLNFILNLRQGTWLIADVQLIDKGTTP